jgi:hypothetical protein
MMNDPRNNAIASLKYNDAAFDAGLKPRTGSNTRGNKDVTKIDQGINAQERDMKTSKNIPFDTNADSPSETNRKGAEHAKVNVPATILQ